MTKTSEEALIAILVEKLGGSVEITHEDLARADDLALIRWDYSPARMSYKLTTERPPEILAGEIVTAEPQSIEPPKHQHETWQLARRFDGWLFCQACGEDIEHDPEMTINTYESLQ